MIAGVIAFFQGFYRLAGIRCALKTILDTLFQSACLNPALPAVLWLSFVTVQAARTGLFMVTVLITDHAVHSTGGEHGGINGIWHFHGYCSFRL